MAEDVALLTDATLPDTPGICCRRNGLRDVLSAAGATVAIGATQPVDVEPLEGLPGAGRAARLPRVLRRPAGLALRSAKRLRSQVIRRLRSDALDARLAGRLAGVGMVLAESFGTARAALAAGVPGGRIWVVAVPAESLHRDEETGYAAEVAAIAPQICGFVTDSEDSRDSLERASAQIRPMVELLPLAADQVCPQCGSVGGSAVPVASVSLMTWDQDGVADMTPAAVAFPSVESPVDAGRRLLARALPARSPRPARRTLISGYDLKFIRELGARLDNRTDLNIDLDSWPYLGHRSPQTDRLLAGADTVVAEWARPSAVWFSRNKRPSQFLVVRLHRYELDAPYPRDIDMTNVDAVVYVSPPIRNRIREELGWPQDKLVYIPNYLDVHWLDRPKLPGARFTIGMVGIEFLNKRFDLALDILADLRRQDQRYTLRVRSVMPWHNKYAWARPAEREYANRLMRRIEQDALLRNGVIFDQPGRDMARWYRGVGHVLSMSDIESFHLSVAEGMASRAVPVIRPWPGATEIYGKEWIQPSVAGAAEFILASADEETWLERGTRARAEIRSSVDPIAATQAWVDLLHADIGAARERFGRLTG